MQRFPPFLWYGIAGIVVFHFFGKVWFTELTKEVSSTVYAALMGGGGFAAGCIIYEIVRRVREKRASN